MFGKWSGLGPFHDKLCIHTYVPGLFTWDVVGAMKGSREISSRIVNSAVRKIIPFRMSSQLIVFLKIWQQILSVWKYKKPRGKLGETGGDEIMISSF